MEKNETLSPEYRPAFFVFFSLPGRLQQQGATYGIPHVFPLASRLLATI